MNVFAIDYDKEIKRAKNNFKKPRAIGVDRKSQADSGKRDISHNTEGQGRSKHVCRTVSPDTSSQLLAKYSSKTFWGKNFIMILISMAIFKHFIACHLYIYSLNLFKFLQLLAQLEFCIVEKKDYFLL